MPDTPTTRRTPAVLALYAITTLADAGPIGRALARAVVVTTGVIGLALAAATGHDTDRTR